MALGDRVGDHAVFRVHVASVRAAAISAGTYNTTSLSTYARRAYYREGIVGAPGKHIVLRIYGYRYDELVRVVSHGFRERLSKRTPAIGDYGSVLLQEGSGSYPAASCGVAVAAGRWPPRPAAARASTTAAARGAYTTRTSAS